MATNNRARWASKASLAWQRAHSSLWFIPSLLVLAALALSTVLLKVDAALGRFSEVSWWLFGGTAEGARTVLSVVAGSLITVVAVAFSMTMIALQQASTQFTPRVLRNFTRDRGNQVVLGVYIGTFTYALLVLRQVREESAIGGEFVPSLAISTGMLLALISLALLVYFIHHVSDSLQVSSLLSAIRRELDQELKQVFPDALGEAADDPRAYDALMRDTAGACLGHEVTVKSEEEGYLRRIDQEELDAAMKDSGHVRLSRVSVCVGEYVQAGDVLLRAWCKEPADEAFVTRIRWAFQLDSERSIQQDPLFGIRQLVDISVKALSPGVNDPTTAEQAIDHLGGALALLVHRSMPASLRVLGESQILFRAPTFGDYLDAAFAQIRRAARTDMHVSLYMIAVLQKLMAQGTSPSRRAALSQQISEIVAGFQEKDLTDRERHLLHRAVAA